MSKYNKVMRLLQLQQLGYLAWHTKQMITYLNTDELNTEEKKLLAAFSKAAEKLQRKMEHKMEDMDIKLMNSLKD